MQLCRWIRQFPLLKPREQSAVKGFGQIVAALVGPVHAVLHVGHFRVGSARRASLVFNVPKLEVGPVLAGDGFKKLLLPGQGSIVCLGEGFMPGVGKLVVQGGDGGGFEQRFLQCDCSLLW